MRSAIRQTQDSDGVDREAMDLAVHVIAEMPRGTI